LALQLELLRDFVVALPATCLFGRRLTDTKMLRLTVEDTLWLWMPQIIGTSLISVLSMLDVDLPCLLNGLQTEAILPENGYESETS